MKKMMLAVSALGMMAGSMVAQASTVDAEIYPKSYAVYTLYHPDTKSQNGAAIAKQLSSDYAALFTQYKQPTQAQFIAYEQKRLQPVLEQRREMSLKQTYVRFGILDADKDQKMTLKEFQASGMKTFDEMDKNKDGRISSEDAALAGKSTGTHDGFKVRLPISMPMANTHAEFIKQYGKGKAYATLADYLSARDEQFKATDLNQDGVIVEKEYVDEFMQRFDANNAASKSLMDALFAQQFDTIANGKTSIAEQDILAFAQKLDQSISE